MDSSRIVRSALLLVLFVLLGKLAGATREVALAAQYGTSATVDTYLLALNTVTWPVAVWFSTLCAVLVPLIAQEANATRGELGQFLYELNLAVGACGAALATALYFALPALSNLQTDTLDTSAHLFPLLALVLPSGLISAIYSARMLADERHLNTLIEAVPAMAITVAILLDQSGSATTLVWGTITGYSLQALTLYLCTRGSHVTPRLEIRSPSRLWRLFSRGALLVALSQLMLSATTILDQVMVAHLGPGAIAKLGYASRVLALGAGIGATVITRSTLPLLSKAHLADSSQDRLEIVRMLCICFTCGLVVALFLWPATPLVVKLLFERGAFLSGDTSAVSDALAAGLLQLPFYFVGVLASQALAARRRYATMLKLGLVTVMAKVVANYFFISAFGLNGVMLAGAAVYAISAALLCRELFYGPTSKITGGGGIDSQAANFRSART